MAALPPTRTLAVEKRERRLAELWRLLAMQEEAEEENLEVIKVIPRKCISEHGVEQTVELAESSGKEAGSSWVEKYDTTSTTSATVAKSVGEAQPLGIARCNASTEF